MNIVKKSVVLLLVVAAMASPMLAGVVAVPEIDAPSAGAGVSLLAGGLLLLRARKRK